MDLKELRAKIQRSKTKAGVYDALMLAGVSPERNLARAMRQARAAFQHDEADLIYTGIKRLEQIENKEA